MLVSFIIATCNRRDAVLRTLAQLRCCELDAREIEILVVDNASRDGTAAAIAARFPEIRLIALQRNRGACAKNLAIPAARGQYIVFLDDDSFPLPGSILRMIRHFESDAQLGAAGFTVSLPDGSQESSAYPDVFIGCGVGFRRRALEQVGGLPDDFFMQAEEYDLTLRLMQAGWSVRTLDDLHVLHEKSPAARRKARTVRLDVRNNYVLASRHFPPEWRRAMRADWMQRYRLLAARSGHRAAFWAGFVHGMCRASFRRRTPVRSAVFEQFARARATFDRIESARDAFDIRRALFLDYGKNMLPFWLAARTLDIEVVAVADDGLAGAKARYRGVPIITTAAARRLHFDAAIVSNSSPLRAQQRAEAWRRIDPRPVINTLEAPGLSDDAVTCAAPAASRSLRTAVRIA